MAREKPAADCYKSFTGIDCGGDSRRLIKMIRRHIDDPAKTDGFWPSRTSWAKVGDAAKPDELRLVCSYVTYIGDLFERYGDSEGLELLQRLEEQCC